MKQETKNTLKLILLFILGVLFVILFAGALMKSKRSKIILSPDVYQVNTMMK